MKLFLSEAMSLPGTERTYPVSFERTAIREFPVTEEKVTRFSVLADPSKKIDVTAEGELELEIPCARCLKPVKVRVPFSETVRLDPEKQEDEFHDPVCYLKDHALDTDEFLRELILPEIPARVLCREDCKGLCPVCGQNLNEGPCACKKPETTTRLLEAFLRAGSPSGKKND